MCNICYVDVRLIDSSVIKKIITVLTSGKHLPRYSNTFCFLHTPTHPVWCVYMPYMEMVLWKFRCVRHELSIKGHLFIGTFTLSFTV